MDILPPLDKEFLQSFNVSSLREFVDWQQLKKISETNNLQPDSTLALASFIGNKTETIMTRLTRLPISTYNGPD